MARREGRLAIALAAELSRTLNRCWEDLKKAGHFGHWLWCRMPALSSQMVIVTAMCTVLAVTTGSEHTLATWLAPFGVNEGALSEQRMAVMSSTFWGVMCVVHFAMLAHAATRIRLVFSRLWPEDLSNSRRCAGRIAWTFLSTVVSSSWSMLFFDIAISLISSLLLFWLATVSLASTTLTLIE